MPSASFIAAIRICDWFISALARSLRNSFWPPGHPANPWAPQTFQRRLKMKMQRHEIDPPELFKHPSFKRVVTVQGDMKLVFIAGQTPSDENYQCIAPGDYRAQYVHVMKNLDIQLKAAGADWDDVVFRRIFVLDVDAFGKIYFDKTLPKYGDGRPPSTLIGVTRLSNPEYLIEIDLMAVVDPAK
jgi:enamine deaminase RidA (YjgF/YER057c/UK114 family)